MKRISSRRLEKGSQPLVYWTVPFILHVGKYQNTWTIVLASYVNSQAPDVPELAHRGIFRLSRLSFNSYHKTAKKYYPLFCPADPMKIIVFFVKCSWNSKNSKKNLDSENTFYGFYSIFSY